MQVTLILEGGSANSKIQVTALQSPDTAAIPHGAKQHAKKQGQHLQRSCPKERQAKSLSATNNFDLVISSAKMFAVRPTSTSKLNSGAQ
jgi:hypothetical protein